MQERLNSIIADIEEKTGVSVAIYDFLGELVAKSPNIEEGYAFKALSQDVFVDGIYADSGVDYTYFLINVSGVSQPHIGVLRGSDKSAVGYAFMISSLIENALKHYTPDVNEKDLFSSILLGKASTYEIKSVKEKYGFPNGIYYVYAVNVLDKKIGEIMNFLASFSTSEYDLCVIMDKDVLAYVKYISPDEDSIGVNEFAVMLAENVKTELCLNLSICAGGIARGVHDFRESYAQAVSGLNMGKYFNYAGRVYSYKEFLMASILEELPRKVIENYKRRNLNPETVAIFEDPDLTLTAEVFMNHSLNISETARSLYVHRNTLMYRLDKIERDTGLNIRVFSDAVTFRILEILYKMNEKQ